MIRFLSYLLIGFYLLVPTIYGNHHNHSLTEPENDTCPVWTLNLTTQVDTPFAPPVVLFAPRDSFAVFEPETIPVLAQTLYNIPSLRAPPAV